MVAVVELDGADKAALVALLRVLTLRAILTKLQPPSPRSELYPAPKPSSGQPSAVLGKKKRRPC
jgi:hypothetical protein